MDLSEEMCFLKLLESLALSSESVLISPSPHFVLDKMASPTYCPSYHQDGLQSSRSMSTMLVVLILELVRHTGEFPKGVGHRVENGWGLTKVAVVLLNGLIW